MGAKSKREDFTPSILENVTCFLEKNIRGVQLGIYTVAVGGLVVALWSVRPFKKFVSPSDIPRAFVKKHVTFRGNVIGLDVSPTPRLLVDHYPLMGSRFRQAGPGLPVKIEGVSITPNGVSWLQTVVVGQNVCFVPLLRYSDSVGCIVTCNNKNVANSLVSLGFASVDTYNAHLEGNKVYMKYYERLLRDESLAERSASGMWWDTKIPLTSRFLQKIKSKIPHLSFRKLKHPVSIAVLSKKA